MTIADLSNEFRALRGANPVNEADVARVGIAKYGSSTGAANDAGVMCFGYYFGNPLASPEARVALAMRNARYFAKTLVTDDEVRSGTPANALMPAGVTIPDNWEFKDYQPGDHQHEQWNLIWLASALLLEYGLPHGTEIANPWSKGFPLSLRTILAQEIALAANGLAGVARMPYLQQHGCWALPDGTPKFNPDPTARGWAGPLYAAIVMKYFKLSLTPKDEAALGGYLNNALDCYERCWFSFFTPAFKSIDAKDQPTTPYFIPAQEAQFFLAIYYLGNLYPQFNTRVRSILFRALPTLCSLVGSCSDGATPWGVSLVSDAAVPPDANSPLPIYALKPHRASFDPSAWMYQISRIGASLSVPGADKAMRIAKNRARLDGSLLDESPWISTPVWDQPIQSAF